MAQVQANASTNGGQFLIQDQDHATDQNRFSGRFLIQDRDHMSGIPEVSNDAGQPDQAQSGNAQQGGEKSSRKGRKYL